MKKTFLIVAASLAAFVSCSSGMKTEEEINAYVEKTFSEATGKLEAIKSDENLSAQEQNARIDSLIDVTMSEMIDVLKPVVLKNKDNNLSIVALKPIVSEMDQDEVLEIIESLGEEQRNDEFIAGVKTAIEHKVQTAEGKPFVDFEVDGVKFSDFIGKGKYVLVDFWASWCGPCKREIPNIAAVYEKYKGEDFDVLSIAVWDKPEDTKAAAEEHGVVWNQIINAQRIPTEIYGIEGIPQIMLFGPDGTILKRDLRGADIEAAVSQALGR